MNPRKWLYIAVIFTGISGIAMVVGALIPGALDPVVSLVFGNSVVLDAPARLATGIAGAVMAGWATSLTVLIRKIDELQPALIGTATLAGICVWFVLDGIVSVTTGATLNLIGNIVFLLIFAIPAWRLREEA